jgi:hypothetical protein
MQKELEIMSQIAKLLEQLDAPARSRVIGWTISALDVQVPRPASSGMGANKSGQLAVSSEDISSSGFAELFHAAGPRSEKEKALVAAYWVQQSSGADRFVAQQLKP